MTTPMGRLALIAKKFVPNNVEKSRIVSMRFRHEWDASHAALSPQMPIVVAIDVLQSADRRLFPDAQALAEAVVGQLSRVYGTDTETLSNLREFVDTLMEILGVNVVEPSGGRLVRQSCAQLLISAFGVAMRDALEEK